MLKIGEFSKMSRISIRMLRHYDEIGLLKPETVDAFTGYRYYKEVQLVQAGRIQALKNMGFGLGVIQEILDQYSNPAELERFLAVRSQELEAQAQAVNQRLQILDSTMKWLRKDGNIMGYDVSLKTIPELYAASVRQVIPTYADEGSLWKILMEETGGMHLQSSSPGYHMALYHDGEFKETDVDVEIRKSVMGVYSDTEHVKFKTLPAVQAASATFKGSYEQISQVNVAVAEWIADNGYEYAGLAFNIYHVSPGETKNPEEYVTEICYPVKKKNR